MKIRKSKNASVGCAVVTRVLDFLSVKREMNPSSLSGVFSAALLLLLLLSPFKHRKHIYTSQHVCSLSVNVNCLSLSNVHHNVYILYVLHRTLLKQFTHQVEGVDL